MAENRILSYPNLLSCGPAYTEFTGIGGRFHNATYQFSASSTQYLNPASTYHNIVIDSDPNSGSNLTLYLPEDRAVVAGSCFWFLFVSQSNAGDKITFLPWDSLMTVNQNASYTFTCSGQKTLLILALVPKTRNFVVHALSAGSHFGNIVPTEVYTVKTAVELAGSFIYTALDPTTLVDVIPDMSTYITPLNPNPDTTHAGFVCNISGWYRISPNGIECNIQFGETGGAGPIQFGIYQVNATPFLEICLWPTTPIDNGSNDFYGTAAGGCVLYLEAGQAYYMGFTFDSSANISALAAAGTLAFEYLSSNPNTPSPVPSPMAMPPPPAPMSFARRVGASSALVPTTRQQVSSLKSSSSQPRQGQAPKRQQPPPASKQAAKDSSSQIASSLKDIESVVEQYIKNRGLDILSQIQSPDDLAKVLSSSSAPTPKQPMRKRKHGIYFKSPDAMDRPSSSSSSSSSSSCSYPSTSTALDNAISELSTIPSSQPPPSKKSKKLL